MKRIEYRFNGNVVCTVDVVSSGFTIFRIGDTVSYHAEHDAIALAEAYLVQLKHVTPNPSEN